METDPIQNIPDAGSGGSDKRPGGIVGWYRGTNKKVLFGIIIVVAVVGSLIATQMRGALTYYMTVDELKAKGDAAYEDKVRVGGRVLAGTFQRDASNNISFTIYHNEPSNKLDVRYKGAVPDIFREEGDVIVEGVLKRDDGMFHATNLLAQHPPEFKLAEPGMPHEKVEDR